MISPTLIDVEDSVLVVIDVQAAFLDKLGSPEQDRLLERILWLMRVAIYLQVPLVITAEDIPKLGSVDPQLAEILPRDIVIFNKMSFGLAADPQILGAIEGTQRRTAVLIGLETDVCVAQSALGLLDRGYRVVVIADATGSPGQAHGFGLDRIAKAGGIMLSIKGIFYEWVRTVERSHQVRQEVGDLDDL